MAGVGLEHFLGQESGGDRMASNTGIAFLDTSKVEVPSINLSEMGALAGKEIGAGITEMIADNNRGADRRMKPYFEKVGSGSALVVAFERSDPEFPFYWHYHPEFELTLIINSRGQRLVGDGIADYGPGDLVLLGPNVPHSWRSGPVKTQRVETHQAVVVQFRPDFLGEHFFELEEMAPVAHLLRRASNGLAFGHTEIGRRVARSIANLPVQSPCKRLATLLSALVELADEKDGQILSTLRVKPVYRIADQHRIDEICLFLNKNFTEEIEFAGLAKCFHMDQASLCRFFKRATGRTMTAYLNELRVGAAAQLLINTNDSILDIGFRVGFGNYSNFNRQFKRIKGFGPRTLRHQFSLGMSPEDPSSRSAHIAEPPVH
jgi:AraC-like DNA-binding protein/mannose-6-phosphate isomerase-like protein (cupin superfamily)